MITLCLVGLAVLIACCLLIDVAFGFSLDAAAAVYALGMGSAVMTLTACIVILARSQ